VGAQDGDGMFMTKAIKAMTATSLHGKGGLSLASSAVRVWTLLHEANISHGDCVPLL
jgi:hypothetical protein